MILAVPSKRIVDVAERAAKASSMKQRMACVIYWSDRDVLSAGINRRLSWGHFPVSLKKAVSPGIPVWSVHAEISALIYALTNPSFQVRTLRGAKAYIHRLGGRKSKPCPACYTALQAAGIKDTDIDWVE